MRPQLRTLTLILGSKERILLSIYFHNSSIILDMAGAVRSMSAEVNGSSIVFGVLYISIFQVVYIAGRASVQGIINKDHLWIPAHSSSFNIG